MRGLIALFALAFAACTPMAPPSPPPGAPSPAPQLSFLAQTRDAASCKAGGGNWRPICFLGKPACVVTFPDAGKACSDKADCQGQCYAVLASGPPGTAKAVGVCQQTSDPCGCHSRILKGLAEPVLCVD
jgi:hypothetical protein